jgi:hypothetical protein
MMYEEWLLGCFCRSAKRSSSGRLLTFQPAGNRKSDPHSGARADNGEWHDQSSNRHSTWFTIRLFEAG